MMTCEHAGVLIERRLDGEASPDDDARLDAHAASCPSCAALLEQETALDAALVARFSGVAPSARLVHAVRARVAAEQPAPAAWIPDALNAAGLVLSLVVVPLAGWWGGTAGVVASLVVLAVASYPLLLVTWAIEAGSAEPDPTT